MNLREPDFLEVMDETETKEEIRFYTTGCRGKLESGVNDLFGCRFLIAYSLRVESRKRIGN